LVKNYYEVLGQFGQLKIDHEMAVRSAFQCLLASCGRQFDLTLVPEYPFQPPKLHPVRIDGALLNPFRLARGYWEAKDEHDDLEKEIRAKLERGYPRSNSVFQDSPGEQRTSGEKQASRILPTCSCYSAGRPDPDDKSVFWALAKAGQRLADIHVNYEQQREYPLERIEKGQVELAREEDTPQQGQDHARL